LQGERIVMVMDGWAGWIIAKLGGWDGYPKSKPPGPITFRHGLEYFKSIARG
jgi:hypothetical protein